MLIDSTTKVMVPEWAKVTVYRIVDGVRCPFTGMARFIETAATKRDKSLNAIWTKRPYGQLGKCAEADGLRKAFPDELGGEQTIEEMEGKVINDISMSVPTYSDDNYQKFLQLASGQDTDPMTMYLFEKSLEHEEIASVIGKYKATIQTGMKGKEMDRIGAISARGRDAFSQLIDLCMGDDDPTTLEAVQELTADQYDYLYSQPQAVKTRLDNILDAA